jgi:hypothetical protein
VSEPDDLYGLPLDRFVAERNALAKALRTEGNKDKAARVAALRKPSVAAWTVNQLARTQGKALASLFQAGDELQQAQSELVAGRGDPRSLRDSSRRERKAVEELSAVARGLLSSEGHEPTQATLDRVGETLRAAALDDDARTQVRGACLERELRQVGFGVGGAAPAAASGESAASAGEGKRAGEGERAGGAERERAARAGAARAEKARAEKLTSARRAEATARRLAGQSARHLRTARERRDRAAAALGEAEEALAAAAERAEETALAHRRAQQALEDL